MTDMEILGAAIAYTNKCIAGAGGLKGANCTIKSIDPITGGNRITFEWEDNEGHTETSTMDVMDGADGQDGAPGADGQDGVSPTISISTITGGHAVSITDAQGTNTFNVMDGIDGANGSDGKDGKDGTNGTNGTDGVGVTSITFKGTDASGNNIYTVNLSNNTSYDITCPKGPAGATGSTGPAGPGVASGGTADQVLVKKSATDYDTDWKTLTKSDVGLGNVPNVSTNDQTPTFTEASTRNNIASGEKLSVIMGKIQKFFNDLKTVAFTGSYTDLTNKPTIPTTASGITYNNTDSGLTATNVQGAVDELALSQSSPLSHNGIYTGRNLGTINNATEWAAFREQYGIADKTYKGLYLGDYVKVNDGTYNADWMVAGFNTETNKGGTNICPECVSMIPRLGDGCGTSYMNSTNVTTGGYVGSYMYATKLPAIATKLTTIFGTNLLTRDILASNTVTNGYASNWAWTACKCSLLTSVQVYGSLSFENTGGTYYAGYNIGEGCEKLPVFNFINPVQFSLSDFWLRGVYSATYFCCVSGGGTTNYATASVALGVRPLICLN